MRHRSDRETNDGRGRQTYGLIASRAGRRTCGVLILLRPNRHGAHDVAHRDGRPRGAVGVNESEHPT